MQLNYASFLSVNKEANVVRTCSLDWDHFEAGFPETEGHPKHDCSFGRRRLLCVGAHDLPLEQPADVSVCVLDSKMVVTYIVCLHL